MSYDSILEINCQDGEETMLGIGRFMWIFSNRWRERMIGGVGLEIFAGTITQISAV
jgi:hypothetical protein